MGALWRSEKGFDFSSEGRVVNLHLHRFDDPDISWDLLSANHVHDVPSDELLGRQLGHLAVSHHLAY